MTLRPPEWGPPRVITGRERPHPILDRGVRVLLIVGCLLIAAGLAARTSHPVVLLLGWGAIGLGGRKLWHEYREHTAAHALSPPAQPKAVIPLLVRLYLLPGAHRVVGATAVNKARRIRFLRTDMAQRVLADRDAAGRRLHFPAHEADRPDPTCLACRRYWDCFTSGHLGPWPQQTCPNCAEPATTSIRPDHFPHGRTLPQQGRHGWM